MTIRTDSALGRTALAVAHCAGMVDLVALPVWVGVLVAHHRFDPQQAGALVTLFLAGPTQVTPAVTGSADSVLLKMMSTRRCTVVRTVMVSSPGTSRVWSLPVMVAVSPTTSVPPAAEGPTVRTTVKVVDAPPGKLGTLQL